MLFVYPLYNLGVLLNQFGHGCVYIAKSAASFTSILCIESHYIYAQIWLKSLLTVYSVVLLQNFTPHHCDRGSRRANFLLK